MQRETIKILEGMSDFQLNKLVAEILFGVEVLHEGSLDFQQNFVSKLYYTDDENIYVINDDLTTGEYLRFDPINDWLRGGKILQEGDISLNAEWERCCDGCSETIYTGFWTANYKNGLRNEDIEYTDQNPLRAVMIVFLLSRGVSLVSITGKRGI